MARVRNRRGQLVYRGVHTTVHFKLNRVGVAAVAVSRQVGDACEDWAKHKAMPYAVSISPRSRESDKKHYFQSFEVHSILTGAPPASKLIGRPPMLRRGAILINTSPYAIAVEYGEKRASARQKSHRVLGKTLARFRRPVKPR